MYGRATSLERMAEENGINHTVTESQVGANAAVGIIGRQGLGMARRMDLSYFSIQAAVRAKPIRPKKIPTCDNTADIGTNMLDQD